MSFLAVPFWRFLPAVAQQSLPRILARPHRGFSTLCGAAFALTVARPSLADATKETPGVSDGSQGTSATKADPREVGVGLTGMIGNGGTVANFGLGVDAWYRPFENIAFGVELQLFANDNGADPQYCYGCVSNGSFVTAFVEGRLVPNAIVSPFLRVGVGGGSFRMTDYGDREGHPVLTVAAGPQLTVWHVFLRLRGTLTATPPSTYFGFGPELGGVF